MTVKDSMSVLFALFLRVCVCVCVSVCLSVRLSVRLSVCLSDGHFNVYIYFSLSLLGTDLVFGERAEVLMDFFDVESWRYPGVFLQGAAGIIVRSRVVVLGKLGQELSVHVVQNVPGGQNEVKWKMK